MTYTYTMYMVYVSDFPKQGPYIGIKNTCIGEVLLTATSSSTHLADANLSPEMSTIFVQEYY
jgi:hypothetical protein